MHRTVMREAESHRGCTRRSLRPSVGETSAAEGPVVATVKFEVAVPLAGGVMESRLSAHVGAEAGVGDTEQLNDTALLNASVEVAVMENSAEAPDFSVALPGAALKLKSEPFTTWLRGTA